jgi:hypothetical protein
VTAALAATPSDADAPFTAADFAEISRTVAEVAGIQLRDGKEGLVRARLARRLREVGARSYRDYLERLRADATRRELAHMVDLLTTNKTSFFREPAHFDVLRDAVAPAFAGAPGGLRVWSAGCSSGEEPYTIAMVLRDALAEPAWRQARVLGTDISARVLARARAGAYADDLVADVDPALVRRHFARPAGGGWAVAPGPARGGPVRAPQPHGAVADARAVPRDLLPQRDDLLRQAHAGRAGRPLLRAAGARRLPVRRALREPERRGARLRVRTARGVSQVSVAAPPSRPALARDPLPATRSPGTRWPGTSWWA